MLILHSALHVFPAVDNFTEICVETRSAPLSLVKQLFPSEAFLWERGLWAVKHCAKHSVSPLVYVHTSVTLPCTGPEGVWPLLID